MKIVFLDSDTIGEAPNLNELKKLGSETIFHSNTNRSNLTNRIYGANIVITNKVKITKEDIFRCDTLKLICVAASGTDNVDVGAATNKGIEVKNVIGYSTFSVSQVTLASILFLLNNVHYYDNYVKSGKYSEGNSFTYFGKPFWEIKDKIVGIIGLGKIGNQTAKILSSFGAHITYYSTSGKNNSSEYTKVGFQQLLQNSDIVCIHAPLNQNTKGLIAYKDLVLMKSTSLVINIGRGGIINESDLARAIDSHVIGGAAVDVFDSEPPSKDNPLLNVKNKHKILLTPHLGWASIEARTILVDGLIKNIRDFLNPRP